MWGWWVCDMCLAEGGPQLCEQLHWTQVQVHDSCHVYRHVSCLPGHMHQVQVRLRNLSEVNNINHYLQKTICWKHWRRPATCKCPSQTGYWATKNSLGSTFCQRVWIWQLEPGHHWQVLTTWTEQETQVLGAGACYEVSCRTQWISWYCQRICLTAINI